MIESLLTDPLYLQARSQRLPYQWGVRDDIPRPTWESLLENLARSRIVLGGLKEMPDFGFVDYMAHRIKQVGPICQELQALSDQFECTAHNYISFSSVSGHYPKHQDDSEVWTWQLYGSAKWEISISQDQVLEFTTEPGSWHYIPSMMPHRVTPLGARAGISFALEECRPIRLDPVTGKKIDRMSRGVPR